MKATGQYFPLVLFVMMCRVVLTFDSVEKISSATIHMKAVKTFSTKLMFAMQEFSELCMSNPANFLPKSHYYLRSISFEFADPNV